MIHAALNILMIEDNPADQFLVTELLTLSPVNLQSVFTASTISEATGILRAERVDIILLDLSLPDSTGIASFTSVKEHASHIPVIILSGYTDMNIASEAITLGAQDYLLKGDFDEKLLAKTIFYSLERMQNIIATEEMLKASEEEKQKEITDAVITAQENERHDIGRELHDNINQLLTTSRLFLGMLNPGSDKDRSLIGDAAKFIDNAIAEIRRLSHTLIPPSLERSRLKDSLIYIFEITSRATGLAISRDFAGFNEETASDKLKLAVYRIVQEQINNIIRHARASHIHVKLSHTDGETILSVKDDGVGFNTSQKSDGIGLKNITTRASLFNGRVQVLSSPGNGCELQVIFYEHPAPAR
ncbi:MAG: response regulator [Chitinophagaceae bacterium]